MSYVPILDSEVGPDAPITTSLMFRLRDNPIGMFEANPGAPLLNRGAVNIGGTGTDLNWIDSTTFGADSNGQYDWLTIALSANHTIPQFSIHRVQTSVNISGVIDASPTTSGGQRALLKSMGGLIIPDETALLPGSFGKCAGWGDGVTTGSLAISGLNAALLFRNWITMARTPLLGGGYTSGGSSTTAGGAIVILCDGPIVVTGTLDVSDADGSAGSIILISGTSINLTGSTLNAIGGGNNGSGGYIGVVAPVVSGTPTTNVTSGSSGNPGLYETFSIYTQAEINGMLLGA